MGERTYSSLVLKLNINYVAVSGQLHVTSAFSLVDHLEDPGVDGRIILRWIFRKQGGGGGAWAALIWLRVRTGGGHL